MKKLIFSFALLAISVNTAFATYVRTTKNGGPNGYASTKAEKDNEGNTRIDCYDPGYEPCPTKASESLSPIEKNLLLYAYSKIQQGVLSGAYSGGGKTIIWVANNIEMTESIITID